MNKKIVFIAIIVIILAILSGVSFFKSFNNKSEMNIKDSAEQVEDLTSTQSQADVSEELPDLEKIDEEEAEKDIEKMRQEINQTLKTNVMIKQDLIPQENKKTEVIPEKPEKVQLQEKEDAGIIKDSESETIIITREFKVQSPAKYSFK